MKKGLRALTALITFLILISVPLRFDAAADQQSSQGARFKTTVMIYLCGSNLESQFGAATKDLYEILRSGFDEKCTNVVVMAGGTKTWQCGFDSKKTSILEIHRTGMRVVWQSEKVLNMAESETLSTFLSYVGTHYRSDRYALILWDHGGGPNEGACYDELFPGQALSLAEIQKALGGYGGSPLGKKLSWIGFDACLMANLETAYVLREAADCLIASQAEEPSSGWNYAFLKGLESDIDAAETGRRIVDCFFSQESGSGNALTLSCIDLTRLQSLLNRVNDFFEGQIGRISIDTFADCSTDRYRMLDFGTGGEKGSGSFDLVDLGSLADAYGMSSSQAANLKQALSDTVVFSRSNVEGASGLSIYHPYYDRTAYEAQWVESYESTFREMSPNYARYIRFFSRIMTGKALTEWDQLETVRTEEPDGTVRFSTTLSEEQARQFVHADLRLLNQTSTINQGLEYSFHQIWDTAGIALDESRTLTAVFPGQAMYVVDDRTGEDLAGPLDFIRADDNTISVKVFFADENGILDEDLFRTEYICQYASETGSVAVKSIRVYDDLTGEYSSRMAVDEDFFLKNDYTQAMFFDTHLIPTYRGGELLGLREWDVSSSVYWSFVSLPRSWHFEVRPIDNRPDLICATFQITDTQNVRHCSSLVRAFPELVKEYPAVCRLPDSGSRHSTAEVSVQRFLPVDELFLQLQFHDLPEDRQYSKAQHVVLNHSVQMPDLSFFSESESIVLTLAGKDLGCLEELRSVSFDLVINNGVYREEKIWPVTVEFPEPVPLNQGAYHPLAECTAAPDLMWRVWSMEQIVTGAINICCDIQNLSAEERIVDVSRVVMEGYAAFALESFTLPPGGSCVCTLHVYQTESDTTDGGLTVVSTIYEPLALLGIDRIQGIKILYTEGDWSQREEHQAELLFNEAIPYAPILPEHLIRSEEIVLGADFRIVLAQTTAYRDSKLSQDMLSIALSLQNEGEELKDFYFDRFTVNGSRVPDLRDQMESLEIAAHTVEFDFLHIMVPDSGVPVTEVGFDVFIDDVFAQSVTITIEE